MEPGGHSFLINLRVRDDLSGISDGPCVVDALAFTSPSGTQRLGANYCSKMRMGGDATSELFSIQLALPPGAERGIWHLSHLYLEDNAGNGAWVDVDGHQDTAFFVPPASM